MKTKGKLTMKERLLLIVAAAFLSASAFYPWWGLDLVAPQYPEGLEIVVYPSKLGGQIDIINNLNHYIGMAEITEEGFPELAIIPYILWGIVVLILLASLIGSKKLAYLNIGLLGIGGALGIYRMYHWLNTFGTKLDSMAPIKVDPFIPPVVGSNTLANFTTYSSFRLGFYILLLAVLFIILGTWGEKILGDKNPDKGSNMKKIAS